MCSHAVRDARFTQSKCVALLLPGFIMLTGTILHWWWYKKFTINEKWRHDNLVIRSHSILLTLGFAMMVAIAMEHIYHHYYLRPNQVKRSDSRNTDLASSTQEEEQMAFLSQETLPISPPIMELDTASSFLTVSAGRPSIDSVTNCVSQADRPGVYSCGPRRLMESLEVSMRERSSNCCVFYREDSEL